MTLRLRALLLLSGIAACNSPTRAAPLTSDRVAPTSNAPAAAKGNEATLASTVQRATLTIDGMVCEGCAEAAKRALEGVDGVASAEADFAAGTATVLFDPTTTSVERLSATVEAVDRAPAPAFRVTARSVESP